MIFGKIIGGLLGLYSANIIGFAIGVLVGHYFDKSVSYALGFDYAADREYLQQLFFETTFVIMGHIAKSDGRVSEKEVAQTELLMSRLGLTPDYRRKAIELFKLGTKPDFQLEPIIKKFIHNGGKQKNFPILLLEFLYSVASADGELKAPEQDILYRTASLLGFKIHQFEQLLSMLRAQQQFKSQFHNYRQTSQKGELENAYRALGVKSSDNERDIKRAYRKLMSQHHPDKLISQGVPEEMINMATDKAQEIQAAYDLIKRVKNNQ